MTTWTEEEARLRARRDELVRRLERYESLLDQPASPDAEERAVEREDDEVLEDLGLSGQAEIRAIDHALARIREGRYGICETCGDPIPRARLEAIPWASLCRDCA